MKDLRDIVPGGAGLAQLVSNELDQLLQKGPNLGPKNVADRMNQTRPVNLAMHKSERQLEVHGDGGGFTSSKEA